MYVCIYLNKFKYIDDIQYLILNNFYKTMFVCMSNNYRQYIKKYTIHVGMYVHMYVIVFLNELVRVKRTK